MTTPEPPPLIVGVAEVARRLRLPQPLGEDAYWRVEQALRDAQADLEAYLGRPVTPTRHTQTGTIESWDGWKLDNYPVLSIDDVVPELDTDGQATGRYNVTYTAGLDGRAGVELEPLRRYVRAHAMYMADVQDLARQTNPNAGRQVKSLSVDGQSVTYEASPTAAPSGQPGTPGALPTLASCDRWRIAGRRVFQRRTRFCLWPYDLTDSWNRGRGDW